MEYKILSYQPRYFSSLLILIDDVFGLKTKNKELFLTWKYFSLRKPIMKLAMKDDEVIGVYMNLFLPISYGKKEYQSLLCTDMATNKLHRGRGIMRQLSNEVYKEVEGSKFDFTIGFSNEVGVKVDLQMDGYGYLVIGKMQNFYKIPLHKRKTMYSLEKTTSFSEEILSTVTQYFFHLTKSKDYVDWRYLKKPENSYEVYAISQGKKCIGYVVLLCQKTRIDIIDIIGPTDTTETVKQIIIAVENMALERHIPLVSYYVLLNSYWRSVFSRLSYLRRIVSSSSYYLTVKNHQKDDLKLKDAENWFIMSGDIL